MFRSGTPRRWRGTPSASSTCSPAWPTWLSRPASWLWRETAARLWAEGTATQTYLTGGVGAHHRDEAYGDPYELPNERSYCETCAAIASIMFSWRMLIMTGEAKYADLLERTLYNGFLAGISLDGERYIYANPLQVRDDHLGAGGDQDYARVPWFRCACCPPNVMRLIASLEHYVALSGPTELVLHQYVTGGYAAELAAGRVGVRVATDYPWRGEVEVTVAETVEPEWTLTVRVPHWAAGATLAVDGVPVDATPEDGWWRLTRRWQLGDRVTLTLPVVPRLTTADPRVDAARGCVAVERGPLVYCVESADQPGQRLDDVIMAMAGAASISERTADGLPGEIVALRLPASRRPRVTSSWWPYADASAPQPAAAGGADRADRDPLLRLGEPRQWSDADLAADVLIVCRRPRVWDVDDQHGAAHRADPSVTRLPAGA